MSSVLGLLACVFALVAIAGVAQAVGGYICVRRFRRRLAERQAAPLPPITILKPLCGDEPLLEQALTSLCEIDYPAYQIVFGVQDPADPAIAVVERIRARYRHRDIALVVDATQHGQNRKVGNLINMLRAARHDHLVIGDSDVHVMPDYLTRLAAEFADPGTGLVTTLYAGLPADPSLAATLGATWLSHAFLPGALMARALGRRDALGGTMALRRETLDAIGGFSAIADDLADDHMLGRRVQAQGLGVRLAATLTSTTVPERELRPLFQHELRWARTVLSLAPVGFALSSIQYPLAWSALSVGLTGGEDWTAALFLACWLVRAACALAIDKELGLSERGLAAPPPVLLIPLRDLLSMAVLVASYAGDRVEWRGRVMHTRPRPEPSGPKISYTPTRDAAARSAG